LCVHVPSVKVLTSLYQFVCARTQCKSTQVINLWFLTFITIKAYYFIPLTLQSRHKICGFSTIGSLWNTTIYHIFPIYVFKAKGERLFTFCVIFFLFVCILIVLTKCCRQGNEYKATIHAFCLVDSCPDFQLYTVLLLIYILRNCLTHS
jgi:hypothetical protein